MLTCRICDCKCDPSDLRNGIFDDCSEQLEKEEKTREIKEIMFSRAGKQMEIEELLG